uniref:Glycosyltransferase n=1 Tax=Rubia yunnanensis TaxID=1650721 RepID=A0A896API3_9GENT|nr:glycosyltransferase [Rubia yunnanensis]
MEKLELVFIPAPGVGHITSTIEVAKLIANLHRHFSVTILVIRPPGDVKPIPESSDPRLKFLELEREESSGPPAPPHLAFFRLIEEHKPHVRKIVGEMKGSSEIRLAGIVVDMFLTSMIDVANEFGVPSYLFYTSGAAFLGLMFHMQKLRDELNVDVTEFEDSDAEIVVGSYMNPVPTKVMPRAFFEKGGGGDHFISLAGRYRETKGIMINTFQELESHAIQALNNDEKIPPVYPIGPLMKLENNHNQNLECEIIMKWLDLQPDSSVIFLCFGSQGTFGKEQVKQIALALEKSGFRFLWSLRKPPPKDKLGFFAEEFENLEEVLPEGFLQRNAKVGKVIGWAPQVAVLSHPAVGGFVSHCGWNSTLESTWHGVPMAVWPLYAEQQANSFLLVKDLEMAVEIKMDYVIDYGSEKEDLNKVVSADLIENGIRKLMDSNNVGIRKKVKEMQEKSRLAIGEDGSSSASLKCFLKSVEDNISSSSSTL